MQFKWKVNYCDAHRNCYGIENVIFFINADLTLEDGDQKFSENICMGVPYNPDAPFVSYQDITEETVISWIDNILLPEEIQRVKNILSDQMSRVYRIKFNVGL